MYKGVLLFLFYIVPSIANAAWDSQVDDDIFTGGKTATLTGEMNGGAIVFDCTENSLSMSIVSVDETSNLEGVNRWFKILVKVDNGGVINMAGNLKRRNPVFVAVETKNKYKVMEVLHGIKSGRGKIVVGIDGKSNKMSTSGDLVNSTPMVMRFTSACRINMHIPKYKDDKTTTVIDDALDATKYNNNLSNNDGNKNGENKREPLPIDSPGGWVSTPN